MRALLLLPFLALPAAAASYKLPPETAALAPGPDMQTVQATCTVCHSPDYITTQPRGLPDPTAFWTAEVTKMRKAYGAQVDDDTVPLIVKYLATTYGR